MGPRLRMESMFLTLSEFFGCFSKTSRNPGSMPLSKTPVPVSYFSIPSCQNTSKGSIGVGEVAMIELEGIIVRVVSLGGSSIRGIWNLLRFFMPCSFWPKIICCSRHIRQVHHIRSPLWLWWGWQYKLHSTLHWLFKKNNYKTHIILEVRQSFKLISVLTIQV